MDAPSASLSTSYRIMLDLVQIHSGRGEECRERVPPALAIQAHSSPLGIIFYNDNLMLVLTPF
jgi:hypothetical protein